MANARITIIGDLEIERILRQQDLSHGDPIMMIPMQAQRVFFEVDNVASEALNTGGRGQLDVIITINGISVVTTE